MYSPKTDIKLFLAFSFFVLVSYTSFLAACISPIQPHSGIDVKPILTKQANVLGVYVEVTPLPAVGQSQEIQLFNQPANTNYYINSSNASSIAKVDHFGVKIFTREMNKSDKVFVATNITNSINIEAVESISYSYYTNAEESIKVLVSLDAGRSWSFMYQGNWQTVQDVQQLLTASFDANQIEKLSQLSQEDLSKLDSNNSKSLNFAILISGVDELKNPEIVIKNFTVTPQST